MSKLLIKSEFSNFNFYCSGWTDLGHLWCFLPTFSFRSLAHRSIHCPFLLMVFFVVIKSFCSVDSPPPILLGCLYGHYRLIKRLFINPVSVTIIFNTTRLSYCHIVLRHKLMPSSVTVFVYLTVLSVNFIDSLSSCRRKTPVKIIEEIELDSS